MHVLRGGGERERERDETQRKREREREREIEGSLKDETCVIIALATTDRAGSCAAERERGSTVVWARPRVDPIKKEEKIFQTSSGGGGGRGWGGGGWEGLMVAGMVGVHLNVVKCSRYKLMANGWQMRASMSLLRVHW